MILIVSVFSTSLPHFFNLRIATMVAANDRGVAECLGPFHGGGTLVMVSEIDPVQYRR